MPVGNDSAALVYAPMTGPVSRATPIVPSTPLDAIASSSAFQDTNRTGLAQTASHAQAANRDSQSKRCRAKPRGLGHLQPIRERLPVANGRQLSAVS